jgi:hypothetical protein
MDIIVKKAATLKQCGFTMEDGLPIYYTMAPRLADRSRMFRQVDKYVFGNTNVFARSSNNPDDYNHIVNGTHCGSVNHATGEKENGLSVAYTPEFPAKYMYFVTGVVCGTGSDGEPLLDVSTVKPLTKRLTHKQFDTVYQKHLTSALASVGFTREFYRQLSMSNNTLVVKED